MDATCTIQDSIHMFNLVHKYVSRILGTYHINVRGFCYDGLVFTPCVPGVCDKIGDYVQKSTKKLKNT